MIFGKKIPYSHIKKKCSSPVTIQVFNGPAWLVPVILDNTDKDYFHHRRKFYWTMLKEFLWNLP